MVWRLHHLPCWTEIEMTHNEEIELGIACLKNAKLTSLVAMAASASTVVGTATGALLVVRGSLANQRESFTQNHAPRMKASIAGACSACGSWLTRRAELLATTELDESSTDDRA